MILHVLLFAQMTLFQNIWPDVPEQQETMPTPMPPLVSFGLERDQECQQAAGSNIFGESAFVRGEKVLPPLTDDMIAVFAAARASNDLDQIRVMFEPILNNADGTPAVAARIELSMNLLRFSNAELGEKISEIKGLLSPPNSFWPYSDFHYIQALLAQASGDRAMAISHLENALDINPDFYNAVQLRSILILLSVDDTFHKTNDCKVLLLGLQTALSSVAKLGSCPLQLAHFQLALERFLPGRRDPQRKELLNITEIAIAFIARKDALHHKLLSSYFDPDGSDNKMCIRILQELDFGNAAE